MDTELSNWFLRFAITPKCNFRCEYCNPAGLKQEGNIVKEDDIVDILKAVKKDGVNRVHWTGGEPTIMDIEYLISSARQIGFKEQVMTTNGSRGGKLLRNLVDKGLSRLIVSLDTLDPERFEKVTKTKHFYDVLDTIETSVAVLYAPTKVNVVYMQETKSEIPAFVEYGKRLNMIPNKKGDAIVKFIEMSQNNPVFHQDSGKSLYTTSHSTRNELFEELSKIGDLEPSKVKGNNPNTEYYKINGEGITIGLITIPSLGYKCGGNKCTKIRMNPYGAAAVCISQEPTMMLGKNSEEKVDAFKDLMESRARLNTERPNRQHYKGDFGYWRFGSCGEENK